MSYPGWTRDGHIVTWSIAFSPSIWRLRPITHQNEPPREGPLF